MRESVRAYLTAGLSTVAVGAIIATPMSPLPRQAASPRPQVRVNDVHLAALSAPSTVDWARGPVPGGAPARRGIARIGVHEGGQRRINRSRESAVVFGCAGRAGVPAGVVTAQNPATADAPDSDNRQAVMAPQSAVVNAIDGTGNRGRAGHCHPTGPRYLHHVASHLCPGNGGQLEPGDHRGRHSRSRRGESGVPRLRLW